MPTKTKKQTENLDVILARAVGVRKDNKKLPFAKSINGWISDALRAFGYADKVGKVHWQLNEALEVEVARAKYVEILGMRIFTFLEFGSLFFEHTTGPAQRREIVFHEIAHVVDCWNGNMNLGHGKAWKALMKTAGLPAKTSYELV